MINSYKNTLHKHWILYAIFSGLTSTLLAHIFMEYVNSSEFISHTIPGAIYGIALYFVGIVNRVIPSETNKRISLFIILTIGTSGAWYAAIKNIFSLLQGNELGNIYQMITSGCIGAFTTSLILLLCWSIYKNRLFFTLIITLTGGVGGAYGYGILKYTHTIFDQDIRMILLFWGWQSAVLIAASLFIKQQN